MRKLLLAWGLLLPALGLGARPASAAGVAFTPLSTILSTGTPQSVRPIAGGFRLYFIPDGFSVRSASSADGANWTVEPGVRLSTSAGGLDASSITACGVFVDTNGVTRMEYVGVSSTGSYHILSASSTDGLAFFKEPGLPFQINGGRGFLDSPRPFFTADGVLRLYYVRDNGGANVPANYRVFSASSPDAGLTWIEDGPRMNANAYQIDITTLTDGRMRLYMAVPTVSGSSATLIQSAVAADSMTFVQEADFRLSTAAPASLGSPVVFRSTETFRWRLLDAAVSGSTTPFVFSSLTLNPTPLASAPNRALNSDPATAFTLSGEIFSPGAGVTFTNGASTITAAGVAVTSDLGLTGTFNPSGAPLGTYDLVVANADGIAGTLRAALTIDFPAGQLSILDNLFKPLAGGKVSVTCQVFNPGHITAKLYTLTGQLVKTVFDADVPIGNTTFTWSGDTSAGNTVASGLYLLHVVGPKLDTKQKVIVIK